MHRKALGRGLDALIPTSDTPSIGTPAAGVRELEIAAISPNPFQPRTEFDDQAILDLAASIRTTGVLQPILVRRHDADGYQLVAGERRLRAARMAGLNRIPAIMKDLGDREMLEVALIENVQREDLNPIEEAHAYQALVESARLTHDQISDRVGKQRASVTNAMRLLLLPEEIQGMVSRGTLSAGHARALLSLESSIEQLSAAKYVQLKGFSVRRTEAYVRRRVRKSHTRPARGRANGLAEWEDKLQQKFGTRVIVSPGRKGGKVEFEYYGQEDLERLLEAWGVL